MFVSLMTLTQRSLTLRTIARGHGTVEPELFVLKRRVCWAIRNRTRGERSDALSSHGEVERRVVEDVAYRRRMGVEGGEVRISARHYRIKVPVVHSYGDVIGTKLKVFIGTSWS